MKACRFAFNELIAVATIWTCLAGSLLGQTNSTSSATPAADTRDITTRSGKTYRNCGVGRSDCDGVTYTHSSGIVKIRYADLPDDIQSRYGYDAKNDILLSSYHADPIYWFGRIGQNYGMLDGKMVRCGGAVEHISGTVLNVASTNLILVSRGGRSSYSDVVALDLPDTRKIIDDALVSFLAVDAGIYEYVAVSGARKQVRLFKYVPRVTCEEFLAFGKAEIDAAQKAEIAEVKRAQAEARAQEIAARNSAAAERRASKEREYAEQRASELDAARREAEAEAQRKAALYERFRLKSSTDFR